MVTQVLLSMYGSNIQTHRVSGGVISGESTLATIKDLPSGGDVFITGDSSVAGDNRPYGYHAKRKRLDYYLNIERNSNLV